MMIDFSNQMIWSFCGSIILYITFELVHRWGINSDSTLKDVKSFSNNRQIHLNKIPDLKRPGYNLSALVICRLKGLEWISRSFNYQGNGLKRWDSRKHNNFNGLWFAFWATKLPRELFEDSVLLHPLLAGSRVAIWLWKVPGLLWKQKMTDYTYIFNRKLKWKWSGWEKQNYFSISCRYHEPVCRIAEGLCLS